MLKNLLYDPFQSAYRKQHSTETAILKVQNDIIASLDVGKCTVLGSLDLSAASDTVDHHILLKRMRHLYGIFVGMPLNSIRKLQLAHNAAARVVQKPPPRAHMTPILRQLHWLPVMKRCQFKLLTITFKSLHDDAPEYIQNLVNRYHSRRQLRSVNDTLLTTNRNRTIKYGRRLMDTAAAVMEHSTNRH